MFAYLIGKITEKEPTRCTLEIQGVGYDIFIPFTTSQTLAIGQKNVKLFTYVHVREDVFQVYGFADEKDKEIFKLLLSVGGIGPKSALGILSGISRVELQNRIVSNDIPGLISLPGIGKKTAERLIVELRDKLVKMGFSATEDDKYQTSEDSELVEDAVSALVSLGYPKTAALKSIRQIVKKSDAQSLSVEHLVKEALQSA